MIFANVPLEAATGAYLAHSHKTPSGRIRKGQLLDEALIGRLRAAELTTVTVARLTPDDVHEDEAAMAIAMPLAGKNLRTGAASTGRVNLHATSDGLLEFSPELIHAINHIHESITVATLMPSSRVIQGQIVATVKIIPYAVEDNHLRQAVAAIQTPLQIHTKKALTACLIQTRVPGTRMSVVDKTRKITELRLVERNARLIDEQRIEHTEAALKQALIKARKKEPDWILIVGASAISDRQDVVPAAVVAAGGEVQHFGMPMDPGNLLLLARLGSIDVIGMPGCARSLKPNGLDKVLDRLSCGVGVSREWITSLGVGGLLQENIERPSPRVEIDRPETVSALLLCAGSSRRFGESNKLLTLWSGKPLLQHALLALCASKVHSITLVTGHEPEQIKTSASTLQHSRSLQFVHNEAHGTGMASSLVKGLSAQINADAVLVCLADMPQVTDDVVNTLIDAFQQHPDRALYIPTYQGTRGNPVLIARRLFDSILTLEGDTGARVLAKQFPDSVLEVPVDCKGILKDVDTRGDLDS
ncbi:MAG: NTP transferase domain-containing protein [Granulosicoccus sp.]